MEFKIINKDGTEWLFDNMSNKIIPLSGAPSNIDISKTLYPYKGTRTAFPVLTAGKNRKVKKLRIQVGISCNYKCSFCLQGNSKMSSPVVLENGIQRFFEMLDRQVEIDPRAKIELWGGEPLVYWKSLRILIPELRRRYPESKMFTISNGTLLTKEIVNFLIDNRVDLTLSHDAQAYFLRGPDPLDDEDMRNLWVWTDRKYREVNLNFGINTVISQYNSDLYAIQEFFANKLNSDVQFGCEGVVIAENPGAIKYTWFPKKAALALRNSIMRGIVLEPDSNVGHALRERMTNLVTMLANEVPAKTISAKCDTINKSVLGVDLFGNVLTCHNVDPKDMSIGTLDDYDNIKCDKYTHWSKRSNCSYCHLISSCRGNCPKNNNALHIASCGAERMFHGFIFEAVWTLLTGSEIKSMVPVLD